MRARDVALNELKVVTRDHYQHRLARLCEPLYSAWEQCILGACLLSAFVIGAFLYP